MSESGDLQRQEERALATLRSRSHRTLLNALIPFLILLAFVIFAIWQIRETEAPLRAIAESLNIDVGGDGEAAEEGAQRVAKEVAAIAEEQELIAVELETVEVPGETAGQQVATLVEEVEGVRESLGADVPIASLSEEVRSVVSERVALRENLTQSEQALAQSAQDLQQRELALEQNEQALEQSRQTIASLEESRKSLTVEVAALETKAETAETRATGAEQALVAAQASLSELEPQVAALSARSDGLQTKLSEAETRISELTASIGDGTANAERIAALEEERRTLLGDIESLRGEQEKTTAALTAARAAEADALASVDALRGELEAATTSREDAESRVAELGSELESVKLALAETIGQLEDMADEFDDSEVVESLTEQVESLREDVDRARQTAKQEMEARLKAEAEAAALRETLAALQSELEEKGASMVGPRRDGSLTIYFGYDNATITPFARDGLRKVAAIAQGRGATLITVAGFADRKGDADYNRGLSERRAAVVAGALRDEIAKLGLTEVKVRIDARGESDLPFATDDEEPSEENRRVEVTLQ